MTEKIKTTTAEERLELLADLLKDCADELPAQTKAMVIEMMLDQFDNGDYKDEYENPFFVSSKYMSARWKKICNEAATGNDGVFVKCIREWDDGKINTEWRKVGKNEWQPAMESEGRSIATRIENYNYNKETGEKRWKNIKLPSFDVKQLPSGK